jgi:hypothetical protein
MNPKLFFLHAGALSIGLLFGLSPVRAHSYDQCYITEYNLCMEATGNKPLCQRSAHGTCAFHKHLGGDPSIDLDLSSDGGRSFGKRGSKALKLKRRRHRR